MTETYSRADVTNLYLTSTQVWDAPLPHRVKDALASALTAQAGRIEAALEASDQRWVAVPGVDEHLVALASAAAERWSTGEDFVLPDLPALAKAWRAGNIAARDGVPEAENPYGEAR